MKLLTILITLALSGSASAGPLCEALKRLSVTPQVKWDHIFERNDAPRLDDKFIIMEYKDDYRKAAYVDEVYYFNKPTELALNVHQYNGSDENAKTVRVATGSSTEEINIDKFDNSVFINITYAKRNDIKITLKTDEGVLEGTIYKINFGRPVDDYSKKPIKFFGSDQHSDDMVKYLTIDGGKGIYHEVPLSNIDPTSLRYATDLQE